jgi:hypothetical protein
MFLTERLPEAVKFSLLFQRTCQLTNLQENSRKSSVSFLIVSILVLIEDFDEDSPNIRKPHTCAFFSIIVPFCQCIVKDLDWVDRFPLCTVENLGPAAGTRS